MMTHSLTEILPFKVGDEKQIAKIERECFSEPWSEKTILSEATFQSVFFVAVQNNKIVGYVSFRTVLDEGYINNIAVKKDFRRQKIADRLLGMIKIDAICKDLSFLTLEVRASNTAAIELYRKNGYVQTGTRKGFYVKPAEDALLLTLFLHKENDK